VRRALLLAAPLVLAACGSGGAPAPQAFAGAGPDRAADVRVFLPPGYPERAPYPVVYFLHDYFGGDAVLWRHGVFEQLGARMAEGELEPFVVIAPDGDRGYWSDRWDGRRTWESWVTGALRESVEARWAVRRDRAGRAVSGISMGGFGAIKAALRRPDLYAEASSLSGALIPLDPDAVRGYRWLQRRILKGVFGPLDGENVYARNDLRRLVEPPPPAGVERSRLLLRCGREDEYRLAGAAEKFAELARRNGFEVELVLEPGAHDWNYWKSSAVETLAWHGARFAEESR